MYNDSSEEVRNALSALIDNEIDERGMKSVGSQITSDKSVRLQVARYHMISDCMRGEPINKQTLALSAAVAESLQHEPTILSPDHKTKGRRWIQPVVGTALAASIAGLGITFGPQLIQQDKPYNSGGVHIVAQPGVSVSPTLASQKETHWKTLKPELEPRLKDYLEEHSEHAVQGGVQGVMPYTSFVSYDDRQR